MSSLVELTLKNIAQNKPKPVLVPKVEEKAEEKKEKTFSTKNVSTGLGFGAVGAFLYGYKAYKNTSKNVSWKFGAFAKDSLRQLADNSQEGSVISEYKNNLSSYLYSMKTKKKLLNNLLKSSAENPDSLDLKSRIIDLKETLIDFEKNMLPIKNDFNSKFTSRLVKNVAKKYCIGFVIGTLAGCGLLYFLKSGESKK